MNKKNPIDNLKKKTEEKSVFSEQLKEKIEQTSEVQETLPPVYPVEDERYNGETAKQAGQTYEFKCGEENVCKECAFFKISIASVNKEIDLKMNDKTGEISIEKKVSTEIPTQELATNKNEMKTVYHTLPNSGRKDH